MIALTPRQYQIGRVGTRRRTHDALPSNALLALLERRAEDWSESDLARARDLTAQQLPGPALPGVRVCVEWCSGSVVVRGERAAPLWREGEWTR